MKWLMAFALAGVMMVGRTALCDDPEPSKKQIQCNVRICKGDPLGSRESGTVKIQHEPIVVTLENRPAMFISGGERPVKDDDGATSFVPFGTQVTLKPGTIKDGKIRLDVTVSLTTAEKHDDRELFNTESTRMISTVRLGEVVRIRCGRGTADAQTWIEVMVEENHPGQK